MTAPTLTDPFAIAVIFLGLLFGGLLKGATGAGLPVLAVPVIAAFFDARMAVVLLVVPNFIVNAWQVYKYHRHNAEPAFALKFAVAGVAGAGVGSGLLVALPVDILNLAMAVIILSYIALRLAKPAFKVPMVHAQTLVWPAGFGGGVLQGAVGISAPIAVTFANAVRLDRPVFIYTVSVFFAAMCLIQMPLMLAFGLMNGSVVLLGLASLLPLFMGIALGERIGALMDAKTFDRIVLCLLAALAASQLVGFLR